MERSKELRFRLIDVSRPVLEKLITDLTGRRVTGLYTDVNLDTGERIIVFTVDEHMDKAWRLGRE